MTISLSLSYVSLHSCRKQLTMAADKLRHSKWLSVHDIQTKLNEPEPGLHLTSRAHTHIYSLTHTHTHTDQRPLCVHFPSSQAALLLPSQFDKSIRDPLQRLYEKQLYIFFFSPSTDRSIINKLSEGPEGGNGANISIDIKLY